MFASRALLVSVCLALVAIGSASSVDSLSESPSLFAADAAWPSPADLPAPAAESQLMNEISARHREFLFANEATGATGGVSSSSSSTGASGTSDKVFGKATVTFLFAIQFDNLPEGALEAIRQAIYKASGFKRAIEFLQVVLSPVGSSRRRRLLAVGDTQAVATFTPENENDDSAFAASGLLYRQLTECTQADTTARAACQNDIAPGSSLIDALPADLAAVVRVGADRTTGESPRGETVASEGTARDTNAGYYVLGAVLACFIIGALVYFIVHKAPVVKETPDAVERREQGVAMEELRSTSAVPADAGAPAAGAGDDAGSMDYKSVFALKHNVLDKKDGAGPAEPADDNDVHFVLHQ